MLASSNNLDIVWQHHAHLLDQAVELVRQWERAEPEACAFSDRLGPHLRHVIEHYTALLDLLVADGPSGMACLDYDARSRDRLVETNAAAARSRIEATQRDLASARRAFPTDADIPLMARFATGHAGSSSLTVTTSLGRELLFLESHTVHHFALLADYLRHFGIEPGPEFGKAPATIAHERRMQAQGH